MEAVLGSWICQRVPALNYTWLLNASLLELEAAGPHPDRTVFMNHHVQDKHSRLVGRLCAPSPG
jgi:hypothetical protein